MKNFRFLAMLMIMTMLAFTSCDNDDGGDSSKTYAIGDTGPSGVGIVFYVTDGGLHGLEVAPVDQTSATWSNITSTLINTTGLVMGTGSENTDTIIGQIGHTASAAQICKNYRATEEGDWFLPSRDELNAIWDNLVDDGSGYNNGVGVFAEYYYWSSSEHLSNDAWSVCFTNGSNTYYGKNDYFHVRAVRAF